MSHAVVLVALSPEDLERGLSLYKADPKGKKEDALSAAIEYQMEPFSEDAGGGWFADGSRWDWWTIGGRFTGRFAVPGYDPHRDRDNYEKCWLCNGTGKRNDALGIETRRTNPNYGCNGCDNSPFFGKMEKYRLKETGNAILRRDLSQETYGAAARVRAENRWAEIEKRRENSSADTIALIYDVKPETTREEYINEAANRPIAFPAFLRNRTWNEESRMGWFGGTVPTECEIKAEESGREFTGRCLHTCTKTGAKIISWTGPGDTRERWHQLFFRRFIQELPDDTLLVVVDYHV